DLLADGFHRGVRAQESVGQRFVFAQQSQQQVLGLDVRRTELAGFIARKKDYAPCLLRVALKNGSPLFGSRCGDGIVPCTARHQFANNGMFALLTNFTLPRERCIYSIARVNSFSVLPVFMPAIRPAATPLRCRAPAAIPDRSGARSPGYG